MGKEICWAHTKSAKDKVKIVVRPRAMLTEPDVDWGDQSC